MTSRYRDVLTSYNLHYVDTNPLVGAANAQATVEKLELLGQATYTPINLQEAYEDLNNGGGFMERIFMEHLEEPLSIQYDLRSYSPQAIRLFRRRIENTGKYPQLILDGVTRSQNGTGKHIKITTVGRVFGWERSPFDGEGIQTHTFSQMADEYKEEYWELGRDGTESSNTHTVLLDIDVASNKFDGVDDFDTISVIRTGLGLPTLS